MGVAFRGGCVDVVEWLYVDDGQVCLGGRVGGVGLLQVQGKQTVSEVTVTRDELDELLRARSREILR